MGCVMGCVRMLHAATGTEGEVRVSWDDHHSVGARRSCMGRSRCLPEGPCVHVSLCLSRSLSGSRLHPLNHPPVLDTF